MSEVAEAEQTLRSDIARFTHDPIGHAYYTFPWGETGTPLEKFSGPRFWQLRVLKTIGQHLSNPKTRYVPLQISVASGHGVGKSSLTGMVTQWGLDTFPDTRVVITASTDTQLRTKTIPEVKKWHHMAITNHWWNDTVRSIHSAQKSHQESWGVDFIPWSKENAEAFQGLHNLGKRIILIFDEASAIDDGIWEAAEGALTDADTEIIWICFGNPTRNVGRFRECFRSHSKYWKTLNLDAREVESTNKALHDRWAEQYGENSDFFRIRVKGQFPKQSAYQLFSQDDLDNAWGRHLDEHQYNFAAKIISVDPAWTGDDLLVIGMRQGLHYQIIEKIPKNDNDVAIANKIARLEDLHKADAVFIDGGYGTGIISAGRTMGRDWQIVWFSEKSTREDCFNKRAEMYVEARDWLQSGGAIPKDQMLYDEMMAIETVPTMDGKYKIPPKEDIKEIIDRSPNCIDNLAISFAYPIIPRGGGEMEVIQNRPKRKPYDPMERA